MRPYPNGGGEPTKTAFVTLIPRMKMQMSVTISIFVQATSLTNTKTEHNENVNEGKQDRRFEENHESLRDADEPGRPVFSHLPASGSDESFDAIS